MAANSIPQKDAFNVALGKFRARLTGPQLVDFSKTTYDNLQTEIARIQKDQENVKRMMNFPRIQAFLEGMQNIGKVIEVFLNTSNILAFVWGPMKFLLLVRLSLRSFMLK